MAYLGFCGKYGGWVPYATAAGGAAIFSAVAHFIVGTPFIEGFGWGCGIASAANLSAIIAEIPTTVVLATNRVGLTRGSQTMRKVQATAFAATLALSSAFGVHALRKRADGTSPRPVSAETITAPQPR